jgi:hypothetical protein
LELEYPPAHVTQFYQKVFSCTGSQQHEPRPLPKDQRIQYIMVSEDLQQSKQKFLKTFVTRDETCIYKYNIETKQQPLLLKDSDLLHPKEA